MNYKGFALKIVKSRTISKLYVIATSENKIICSDWKYAKEAALLQIKDKIDEYVQN